MELVDRYLQAVRFWMPKSQRQEDLIAELGEDLRSQIEEKENELGHALDQAEIGEILKRCGPPMVVATRLGPQQSLIGPALFPSYRFVLKMTLLWIMVPLFLFIIGPINAAYSRDDLGSAIVSTLASLWSALFIAAGIITLVFAVLERTHGITGAACKWDPSTLPPLQKTERRPSMLNTACELIFGVLGLVWLLLLPHNPWLILGPAATFLHASPLVHAFYLPIVLLAVLNILRAAAVLVRPQWTLLPLASQLVPESFTLLFLTLVLKASGALQNGLWQPFVVLADGASTALRYSAVPGPVNVSIFISLLIWWIGVCIALLVHLWKLVKALRRQGTNGQQPVSAALR